MEENKIYNLKEIPKEDRPRGKLIGQCSDILKNYELLAVILGTGYRDESVLELAHRILQDYGSKAITKEKSVNRLMNELGLPEVKACQIIACFELGRRFFLEDTGRYPIIQSPEDDLIIIKRLVEAGKLLGIDLVDHIIVAKDGFASFKEKGLM